MIDYAVSELEHKAQRGEWVWANRGPIIRDKLRDYTQKVDTAYAESQLPGIDELRDLYDDADNALDVPDDDEPSETERPGPVDGVTVSFDGDGGTDE